jgi:hypothetical protein
VFQFDRRPIFGAGKDQLESVMQERRRKGRHGLAVKVILHIGKYHADQLAARPAQHACAGVRNIAQFLRRLFHQFSRFFSNGGMVPQCARYGGM